MGHRKNPVKKKPARPVSVNLANLGRSVMTGNYLKLEKKPSDPVQAMMAKYNQPRTEEDLESENDLRTQRKKLGGLQSHAVMQDQVEHLKMQK